MKRGKGGERKGEIHSFLSREGVKKSVCERERERERETERERERQRERQREREEKAQI